jgi:uncharacterized membrane protein
MIIFGIRKVLSRAKTILNRHKKGELIMGLHQVILYSLPAFIIWATYYVYLYYRVQRDPLSTAIGTYNAIRKAWVVSVLKSKEHILAVQTLRNWSMSASFLASTASLLALGVLSFVLKPDDFSSIALSHNDFDLNNEMAISFARFKLLFLMVALFASFFSFSLAIRYYNKASFILCIHDLNSKYHHKTYARRTVFNGALNYMVGMRSYYLSVPLSLWLLGTLWLYLGILLILLIQYRTDYRP